jgi:putative glutamine amidotransferase
MSTKTSSSNLPRPVVLVPACNRMLGHHPFHVAGKKYIDAVRLAGCVPLVIPAAQAAEVDELLDLADGFLLTGSASNVHPSHFDEAIHDPSLPLDPVRDDWTLPMIRRALERGIPMFGICRGFQEVNVALGGSLHQAVQEQPGLADHRARADEPVEVQGPGEFEVNSVHGQGIKRLATGLRVEATAPDGLVEAFTVAAAPAFNLCVQWHPEWQAHDNPVSVKLFRAFGQACLAYRDRFRDGLEDRGS